MSNMTSDRIYLQSWVGNEMLNHHKSTVIDIAPGLRGIGIFDLTIYAELMNVSAFSVFVLNVYCKIFYNNSSIHCDIFTMCLTALITMDILKK